MNRVLLPLVLVGASFCALHFAPTSASAVTIDWVTVGDPGNAPDWYTGSQYGSVDHSYRIGKYDVTNSQYVEFLNAKDPIGTNPLQLYNVRMSNVTYGGINYDAGATNGSKYTSISGRDNNPVNYVSWYDAIRFANWLHNGQGSGDTETGAYTLGKIDAAGVPEMPPLTHNPLAQVWLPTEDEWYKAAFYDPRTTGPPANSHYWVYPTSSDSAPNASGPTAMPNSANYFNAVSNLTPVGAYSSTMSPYGAFDMGGNVFQWTEALSFGFSRKLRGSTFDSNWQELQSSSYNSFTPWLVNDDSKFIGFRVAAVIPEPSTGVMAGIGCCLLGLLRRRIKKA